MEPVKGMQREDVCFLIEKNGKQYDRLHIRLKDGTEKDVYFDITDFYGKWARVSIKTSAFGSPAGSLWNSRKTLWCPIQ